tara:strand:+ start:69 stop:653 length:585 start_codon:yes stop_codon:yes gene_type:complete
MSKIIEQTKTDISNIKNKINMKKAVQKDIDDLQKLYKTLWKQKSEIYNANTELINANHSTEMTKNILLQNQNKEIIDNNLKIDDLKGDIMSMSRQVHIAENEYKKKSFYIFLLKHIFIFLLLILLVGLLMKNDNISSRTGTLVLITLGVILGIIILLNYYFNRNRNVLYFDKQNWVQPELKHRNKDGQGGKCGV